MDMRENAIHQNGNQGTYHRIVFFAGTISLQEVKECMGTIGGACPLGKKTDQPVDCFGTHRGQHLSSQHVNVLGQGLVVMMLNVV
jgi:hypothetical protein